MIKKFTELSKYIIMRIFPIWRRRFSLIYRINFWNDKNSRSGPGSNQRNTRNLEYIISDIIRQFSITSIIDVPCGDFKWMKSIIENHNIHYLGGDIVPSIIRRNTKHYLNNRIHFQKLNLIKDKIPDADLLICRDIFIHLFTEDIVIALENISKSNIDFFLFSSYETNDSHKNSNLKHGIDSRLIDFSKPPFNFQFNQSQKYFENEKTHEYEKILVMMTREELLHNLLRIEQF